MSVDPTTTAVFGLTFLTRRPRNAFSWCDPKFSNVPPIFVDGENRPSDIHRSARAARPVSSDEAA
jgi:hypothetical protein